MRVALLTSAEDWRGSGVSYAKIGGGLLERGHEVRLFTSASPLTERLAAVDLPVSELSGSRAGLRVTGTLVRELRRLRTEAVLVDTLRDVQLAAQAALVLGLRVVYRYNLTHRVRIRLLDRLCLRRVSGLVYQSRWIRQEARSRFPWLGRLPSSRIPNGYDTALYAPRPEAGASFRARHGIAPQAFIVTTVARLARHKGHELAIAALDRVRRDGMPVVYVVCGDGAREAELRDFAGSLALPTVFTGLLQAEGVVGALAASDLVVHPSLREIFPNAVGEAMACACPVVAVDGGGTSEVLGRDGAAGLLVPPEDPDAMAIAIAGLIENTERRASMGLAARQRIETEFTLARMIDGYERALGEPVEA